jgi:peptidoglycan/LPS O-acetylase OafA/YrhL
MTARRWPALDGLRGIAILAVIVAHSGIINTHVGGMVGVTLFFVLSGFLITYLLTEEEELLGSIDLKAFYGRRALRLLPALVIYLAGIAVMASAWGLALPIWDMTWSPAVYLGNYAQIFGQDLYANRHLWSLAVEEHFYLAWPFLIGLGAARNLKAMGAVIVALILWRIGVGLINPMWAYHGTDTNAYAIGLGCLLAIVYRRGWRPVVHRRTCEVAVAGLVALSLMPTRDLDHLYELGVWLPPLAAGLSTIAVLAAVLLSPAFLTGPTIRWFGAISYSLYLWHAPLLQFPVFDQNQLTRLGAILLAVTIAWLSWILVEGPVLRSKWRRRFSPRPVHAGAVVTHGQS